MGASNNLGFRGYVMLEHGSVIYLPFSSLSQCESHLSQYSGQQTY